MDLTLQQLRDIVAIGDAIVEVEDREFPPGNEFNTERVVCYEIPLYRNGGLEDEPPIARLVAAGGEDMPHAERWVLRLA